MGGAATLINQKSLSGTRYRQDGYLVDPLQQIA
jgi:hypothetical protein